MSGVQIITDGGEVDGYALVNDLLAPLGLTAERVSRIVIDPTEVTIEYHLLNDDGQRFIRDGMVAASRCVLPLKWSKK